MKTECGIYAVFSKDPISSDGVITGLKGMQHRGMDSFGVSYLEGIKIKVEKKKGLVEDLSLKVKSICWTGHVRYSTSNGDLQFCQPVYNSRYNFGLVHNGNIPERIWKRLSKKYPDFKLDYSQSDTFILNSLIEFFLDKELEISTVLKFIVQEIEGAYCIVIQTSRALYFVKDRYGIKPLEILKNENSTIVTSEPKVNEKCDEICTVERGSVNMLYYKNNRFIPLYSQKPEKPANCLFEYIYFLRENSLVNKIHVNKFRRKIGENLAKSFSISKNWSPGEAVVCGVPSSGIVYGEAFASTLNLQYSQVLKKKSDYPHRTFILPDQKSREGACHKKYFVDEEIEGKILVLIDDSVVRGTTMSHLVNYLRRYKPKEIHLVVASPPVKNPCFYGVDFPDVEELLANKTDVEGMRFVLNLDSLTYLDLSDGSITGGFCRACFDYNYLF